MLFLELPEPLEFEWDSGNITKSFIKHGITNQEAEQAFVNLNLIQLDPKHSGIEQRFNIIGTSNFGKIIFSAFVIRRNKIRIISSRITSQKERLAYEKTFKENT